jgi:CheY-like chemotaxis protein
MALRAYALYELALIGWRLERSPDARTAARVSHDGASRGPMKSIVPAGMPRVLIIDDDVVVARSVGRMLGTFAVEIETEPLRAVERIRANEPFDVIVCDLKMPSMSGREVLAFIRAHYDGRAESPCVIMTSGDVLLESEMLDAPMLVKPFRAGELRALVSSLLPEGRAA